MDRLEQSIGVLRGAGCSTCRHWGFAIYTDDQGSIWPPEHCPVCARERPPMRVEYHYIGINAETFDDLPA